MKEECNENEKIKSKCLSLLNKTRIGTHDYMEISAMESMASVYLTMPRGKSCRKALNYRVRLMNVESKDVCESLDTAWQR